MSQRHSSRKTQERVGEKHVEEKKTSKKKKSVSGSITSNIKVIDDVLVSKEAIDHFHKMCSIPQIGVNVRLPFYFERTCSKSYLIKASKDSHKKLNDDEIQRI